MEIRNRFDSNIAIEPKIKNTILFLLEPGKLIINPIYKPVRSIAEHVYIISTPEEPDIATILPKFIISKVNRESVI